MNWIDPFGLERIENGLIYDDDGSLIGELPLEDPHFLLDPINYISGFGGGLLRNRIICPRFEGTGKSDIIIRWPGGNKTRFDISGHPHNPKPHTHWWTKK